MVEIYNWIGVDVGCSVIKANAYGDTGIIMLYNVVFNI